MLDNQGVSRQIEIYTSSDVIYKTKKDPVVDVMQEKGRKKIRIVSANGVQHCLAATTEASTHSTYRMHNMLRHVEKLDYNLLCP